MRRFVKGEPKRCVRGSARAVHSVGERGAAMAERFDWIRRGDPIGPNLECDLDLLGHQVAAVVPTIGSLVPGWTLVVPRISALSISQLSVSHRRQILDIAATVRNKVSRWASQTYFFEHGANSAGSATGCGVDQAHLHIVPLEFDLISAALREAEGEWLEVSRDDPWMDSDTTQDYYLISNYEQAYVTYPKIKLSQFFRRIVAREIGRPEEWDYRRYPHYANVEQTVGRFRDSRCHCARLTTAADRVA